MTSCSLASLPVTVSRAPPGGTSNSSGSTGGGAITTCSLWSSPVTVKRSADADG